MFLIQISIFFKKIVLSSSHVICLSLDLCSYCFNYVVLVLVHMTNVTKKIYFGICFLLIPYYSQFFLTNTIHTVLSLTFSVWFSFIVFSFNLSVIKLFFLKVFLRVVCVNKNEHIFLFVSFITCFMIWNIFIFGLDFILLYINFLHDIQF